jgi:hypothetical protein
MGVPTELLPLALPGHDDRQHRPKTCASCFEPLPKEVLCVTIAPHNVHSAALSVDAGMCVVGVEYIYT